MNHFKNYHISIDGLEIRYYAGGKGDPLVIIHGGNSHARNWIQNAKELCKYYRVFIPDLPGFGLSQSIPGDYNFQTMVDFIDKFTTTVGLNKFNLAGHSVGGAIATNYVLYHSAKVKKLILINSMGLGDEIALWVRLLSRPTLCKTLGNGVLQVVNSIKWIAEGMFRSMDFIIPFSQTSLMIGCALVNLEKQTIVLKDRLSEIRVPTLVIWGKNDKIVPVKHAYAAAENIPDCRVKILAGGHCAYSRYPAEFSSSVIGFLNGNY